MHLTFNSVAKYSRHDVQLDKGKSVLYLVQAVVSHC